MLKRRSGDGDLTVGIVHWAVPPTIGGVESHLADYIRLLNGRGVKVVMFSGERYPAPEISGLARFERHDLLHLEGGRVFPKDTPEKVQELAEWFREKISEHHIDVIHGHNLHHFSRVPAAAINVACDKSKIKRHHTYHNYWSDALCVDEVAGWEKHWATSGYVARLCRPGYKVRLKAYYLGIDPERFECQRRPFEGRKPGKSQFPNPAAMSDEDLERAPVILQPARLLPWKGPAHSIEMLRKLHEEKYYVRLVLTATPKLIDWDGERSQLRESLEKSVKDLNLEKWVTFLEGAHYRDMPEHYNQADIVINPSHREPLGLVALEAMAASRPVVVTNSGGMTETFLRGTGALVVDDNELVGHLVDAVRDFLDHPEKAVESGIKGRRHVVKNFHVNKYGDKMLAKYRASLKRTWRRGSSSVITVPVDSFVSEGPVAERVSAL